MRALRTLVYAILIAGLGVGVQALTLPYVETFHDDGWTEGGPRDIEEEQSVVGVVTHSSTDCYSGGCARIELQDYKDDARWEVSGLFGGNGYFEPGHEPGDLHIRWLVYYHKSQDDPYIGYSGNDYDADEQWYGAEIKNIIVRRCCYPGQPNCGDGECSELGQSSDRAILFEKGIIGSRYLYIANNTDYHNPPAASTVIDDYSNQWIAMEVSLDLTSTPRKYTLYVWTRDGAYQGEYHSVTDGVGGIDISGNEDARSEKWKQINIMMGFWAGELENRSGENYFLVDNIALDDEFIGPPDGFLNTTDTTRPGAPGNLQVAP